MIAEGAIAENLPVEDEIAVDVPVGDSQWNDDLLWRKVDCSSLRGQCYRIVPIQGHDHQVSDLRKLGDDVHYGDSV